MTEFDFTELMKILGAGGGGAYLACKVALNQILKSIDDAKAAARIAHERLDTHLQNHSQG